MAIEDVVLGAIADAIGFAVRLVARRSGGTESDAHRTETRIVWAVIAVVAVILAVLTVVYR